MARHCSLCSDTDMITKMLLSEEVACTGFIPDPIDPEKCRVCGHKKRYHQKYLQPQTTIQKGLKFEDFAEAKLLNEDYRVKHVKSRVMTSYSKRQRKVNKWHTSEDILGNDIFAYRGGRMRMIQCTNRANKAHRQRKIEKILITAPPIASPLTEEVWTQNNSRESYTVFVWYGGNDWRDHGTYTIDWSIVDKLPELRKKMKIEDD